MTVCMQDCRDPHVQDEAEEAKTNAILLFSVRAIECWCGLSYVWR